MVKLFGIGNKRIRQQPEIERVKNSQRAIVEQANKSIKEVNDVFRNGFGIKIYKAQHTRK